MGVGGGGGGGDSSSSSSSSYCCFGSFISSSSSSVVSRDTNLYIVPTLTTSALMLSCYQLNIFSTCYMSFGYTYKS